MAQHPLTLSGATFGSAMPQALGSRANSVEIMEEANQAWQTKMKQEAWEAKLQQAAANADVNTRHFNFVPPPPPPPHKPIGICSRLPDRTESSNRHDFLFLELRRGEDVFAQGRRIRRRSLAFYRR
eukprot:SAG31_NODE_12688_length_924_cov_0.911515_2_plen_126_part_00